MRMMILLSEETNHQDTCIGWVEEPMSKSGRVYPSEIRPLPHICHIDNPIVAYIEAWLLHPLE